MKNNCSKLVDSLHKKERYAKESAHNYHYSIMFRSLLWAVGLDHLQLLKWDASGFVPEPANRQFYCKQPA